MAKDAFLFAGYDFEHEQALKKIRDVITNPRKHIKTTGRTGRNLPCPICHKSGKVRYRAWQHNFICTRSGCNRIVFTREQAEEIEAAIESRIDAEVQKRLSSITANTVSSDGSPCQTVRGSGRTGRAFSR